MSTEGTETGQEEGNNGGEQAPVITNEGGAPNEGNPAGTGEGTPAPAIDPVIIPPAEPDEESIKKFFASKGRTVEKLDDLFIEKIKEVNPYADVNDELKQILAFSKETGRGVSDYFKLQENIDEKPLVDVAIAKAKAEAGGDFSKEDLTAYLEDHLGVDLSGDLTPAETLKLKKYVKDFKENFKAEQEKFKTPLPKTPDANSASEVEMITLADGQKVEKSVYEEHTKQRQIYLNDIKEAVNSVAASSIKIEFDNNGVKQELTYGYEYDATDKQDMLSKAEDLDTTVTKLFRTEKGFNHQDFIESTWFLDKVNREKWAAALVNKARAEAITELTKADNNVNLNTTGMPAQAGKPGVKIVTVKELLNR
jgi:ribosomal protein S10